VGNASIVAASGARRARTRRPANGAHSAGVSSPWSWTRSTNASAASMSARAALTNPATRVAPAAAAATSRARAGVT